MTDTGPLYGRQAVEKFYADHYQQWHVTKYISGFDQDSPYIVGTAGNEIWANGPWSFTAQAEGGDPFQLKGYWSSTYIREGDDWKMRWLTITHLFFMPTFRNIRITGNDLRKNVEIPGSIHYLFCLLA